MVLPAGREDLREAVLDRRGAGPTTMAGTPAAAMPSASSRSSKDSSYGHGQYYARNQSPLRLSPRKGNGSQQWDR